MRLLVVDDHEVVRRGVRSLLSNQNGWDVCGEAVDGQDAIEKARELEPDLIVMDVSMPRLNGLEATLQVRNFLPQCEVLILSQHENSEMAQQALKAGARGYVVKSSISRDLISAVEKASRHEYFFDPAVLDQTSTTHTDVQEVLQRSAAFEKALRQSEERLRRLAEYQSAVMNNMAEGLYAVDENGLLTSINPAGETILGWTKNELIGKKMHDVTHYKHPDGCPFPSTECPALQVARKGIALREHEDVFIRKDGTFVPVVFSASPLREEKRITGVIVSFRDDTVQRYARKATALLAAIVASSDDAIVSKNLDGIIESWNKGAERIFGYTPEEAIGKHITLIIPSDHRNEEDEILARLRRGERIDHFQTVRRSKDGMLHDVSVTISPIKDSSGRIVGASKVARDVTAQKRTDQALRESEQRYRVVTDAAPVMVWMAGTDKLCYYFNKGWLDFVGRPLEQEAGNGWAENVHPDDFDRCLEIYVSNFDARRAFEMEYRMRHHTGQYRWIFDRGIPRFAPDGTFEGYVGGCLDIHERKEAAEKVRVADDMTRLMKAQDEERRRIARELHDSAGQTLTVLGLSLAQLVERAQVIAPELAKEGKEIEGVVQQLHREIRTTSYLLHPPLLDECGLRSAVNWYVEGLARRSGLAIDLDIADTLGRLPSEMELAIFRLVQECLTNIHRHSGSKAASIRIFVERNTLHAEVSDQGRGIMPERLAEIRSGAAGVGIRGMQERLRQFGGTLIIESNGAGTRVVASLPIPKEVRSVHSEPLQAAV
jgi:PAS domain S-box-containing protein